MEWKYARQKTFLVRIDGSIDDTELTDVVTELLALRRCSDRMDRMDDGDQGCQVGAWRQKMSEIKCEFICLFF